MRVRHRLLLIILVVVAVGAGGLGLWWQVTADDREMERLVTRLSRTDSEYPSVLQKVANIGPPIVPRLIELLDCPDPDRQLCATDALAHIGDQRALDPLYSKALATPHDDIRRGCIGAIAATDSAKAERMVRRFLKHPDPDLRSTTTWALTRRPGDARRWVKPLLDDDHPEVRAAALGAMCFLNWRFKADPAQTMGLLRRGMRDPSFRVRQAAIRGLVGPKVAAREAEALIVEGLKDEMPEVRGAAVDEMLILRSPGAVEALSEVASNDADPVVRAKAMIGIAELGGADALGLVKELLMSGDDMLLRTQAVYALGRLGTAEAAAVLRKFRRTADLPLRLETDRVLSRMGRAAAPPETRSRPTDNVFEGSGMTRERAWSLLAQEFGGREVAEKRVKEQLEFLSIVGNRADSADAVALAAAQLVALKQETTQLRRRLLHEVDHEQLLRDCRDVMSRVRDFETVYPTSPRLPESIRRLPTTSISLQSNAMWLYFSHGRYTFCLKAWAKGETHDLSETPHDRRLIDGLWFHEPGPFELLRPGL